MPRTRMVPESELSAANARIAELTRAYWKYAHHLVGCSALGSDEKGCDCGMMAALSSPAAAAKEHK